MSQQGTIHTQYWCERVRIAFTMFLNHPHTLQHMLLFGPPGSGKTTSASWLVEQIWGDHQSDDAADESSVVRGDRRPLMCISLNAADERSLESIRQKVFPFLRVDWRTEQERHAPRFLILDECETLTEAAQLSLQTVLHMDPRDLCVILICNSQSRIHPKLRQRLLKIRYDPPNRRYAVNDPSTSSALFEMITRGDLRQVTRRSEAEHRIWKYLHCHPSELRSILREESVDLPTIMTELLLLADTSCTTDTTWIKEMHLLYPFLSDTTIHNAYIEDRMVQWMVTWREKLEAKIHSNLISMN